MSKKNGFSILEAITPMVRLLPPARLRAWRLGWYLSSSMAFTTRARVELLTTLALFNTRDTVAVETLARRATCSRFIEMHLLYPLFRGTDHRCCTHYSVGQCIVVCGLSPVPLPGVQPAGKRPPGGGAPVGP